jgi:hypothetical protein
VKKVIVFAGSFFNESAQRAHAMTRVAAAILLANVHNHRRRVFGLDLKRSDESIFCVHRDVVRLSIKFKPDGKVHWRASYVHLLNSIPPGFETISSS